MGIYDASDRYLKKALNSRSALESQKQASSNMRIVGPIIKLKSE
jgi:hypothetical protein